MQMNTIESIIKAGIAAPSADNSSPWKYKQIEDGLEIFIDSTRSSSISDSRYLLSDLAIGATLENINISASSFGYKAHFSIFPNGDTDLDKPVCKITFLKDSISIDPLNSFIYKRHTNRTFPWKESIEQTKKNNIKENITNSDNNLLWLSMDEKKIALALIRNAESLRFKHQSLHQELFSSINFDIGWNKDCPEKLAPKWLNVELPMRPFFKALKNWSLMNLLNKIGVYKIMGVRAAWLPVKLTTDLVLLTSKNNDRTAIINAGRFMQRIWLTATQEEIAVQPFAAACIYSQQFINISSEFNNASKEIKTTLDELTNGDYGIMFLRMGVSSKNLDPKISRRDIESFKV